MFGENRSIGRNRNRFRFREIIERTDFVLDRWKEIDDTSRYRNHQRNLVRGAKKRLDRWISLAPVQLQFHPSPLFARNGNSRGDIYVLETTNRETYLPLEEIKRLTRRKRMVALFLVSRGYRSGSSNRPSQPSI